VGIETPLARSRPRLDRYLQLKGFRFLGNLEHRSGCSRLGYRSTICLKIHCSEIRWMRVVLAARWTMMFSCTPH